MKGVRINKSGLVDMVYQLERIQKNLKGGNFQQTKQSKIILAELEQFILDNPKHAQLEQLEHLRKRFHTKGDDFQKVTGYGEYNELVSGILTGVYKPGEVAFYKVFDQDPYWEGGDLVELEKDGSRVDMQVKGNLGTLSMRKGSDMPIGSKMGFTADSLNESGFFNNKMGKQRKAEHVKRALRIYIDNSPEGIRIVSPVYPNALEGVFDMGAETFIELGEEYPEAFSFTFRSNAYSKRPYIKRGVSLDNHAKKWLERKKAGESKAIADLQRVTSKIDIESADDTILEEMKKYITRWRIAYWHANGALQFSYEAEKIARLVAPIIRTGAGRHDDKSIFYGMLKKFYGKTSPSSSHKLPELQYYLEYNPRTEASKMPDAFYNRRYHDIRY